MAEKLRRITSAWGELNCIDDDEALQRSGLSMSDYRECERLMPLLGSPGCIAYTIYEKAAGFFKKHGYNVNISGTGYMITI